MVTFCVLNQKMSTKGHFQAYFVDALNLVRGQIFSTESLLFVMPISVWKRTLLHFYPTGFFFLVII